MLQPKFEMEARQNIYAPTTDLALMKPLEDSRSPKDLMTRRLKNRERQRRYRARKRLEADIKKAGSSSDSGIIAIQPNPAPLQIEYVQEVSGILGDSVTTRIYCKRDWKNDARRAHQLSNNLHQPISNGPAAPDPTSASGNQTLVFDDSEMHNRSTLSRRHWKAEARNKKT